MKYQSLLLAMSAMLPLCCSVQATEEPPPPETAAPTASAGLGIIQALEGYRWTLDSATDGSNHRIDTLFPAAGRSFTLTFSASRLSVQGGCNSLSGAYQVNAQGILQAESMVSTQMACAPELMKADTALAALLAQPLQIEIVPGLQQPMLRLLTASNETLGLEGQQTPEALYGPGTLMFLEVDAQQLKCRNPRNGQTTCLQVREISFDEQGLRSAPPGPWRPFYESIDGYSHTSGVRNVLRVKRFQRSAAAAPIYVLDLIVESEEMPPWQREDGGPR